MNIQIFCFIRDMDYEKLNKEYIKTLHDITKGYFHPLKNALYIDKYSKGCVFILPFKYLDFVNKLMINIKKENENTTSYSSIMIKIT